MSYDLAVVAIHGMGAQRADFAEPMFAELRDRVRDEEVDPGRVLWETAWWAPVLQKRENALFSKLGQTGLDWTETRRFIVSAVGDAIAYQNNRGTAGVDVYRHIHRSIHKSLAAVRNTAGADIPLMIIAHSLGCVMATDHIYDAQKERRWDGKKFGAGDHDLERMKTLCSLVTFGCNIPLFALRYDHYDPITFPAGGLSDSLRAAARWLNFYDVDDVLGFPLRPLFPPDKCVVEDRAINVGGALSFWNPLSHSKYWTDNVCTKPVAKLIASVLRAT